MSPWLQWLIPAPQRKPRKLMTASYLKGYGKIDGWIRTKTLNGFLKVPFNPCPRTGANPSGLIFIIKVGDWGAA